MCVILDANMFGEFKDQDNEDMQPVWNWLENKEWQNSLYQYQEI